MSSRHRSGVESESNSRPAPRRAARRTAVKPIAALSTGTGWSRRSRIGRIVGERAGGAAVEDARQFLEAGGEARRERVHRHVHDLEVGGQRTRGHAQPDPTGEARGQPRDLLGHERRWSQRQQQRRGRRPRVRGRLEAPARGLQRIGQVPVEPAVVLARHHAVEAVPLGQRGLGAHLVDDGDRAEVVVRVEAQRHRPGRERRAHRSGTGVFEPVGERDLRVRCLRGAALRRAVVPTPPRRPRTNGDRPSSLRTTCSRRARRRRDRRCRPGRARCASRARTPRRRSAPSRGARRRCDRCCGRGHGSSSPGPTRRGARGSGARSRATSPAPTRCGRRSRACAPLPTARRRAG